MLIGRTGRGQKQDVAARSTARQAARFWKNFSWALAYALGTCGRSRRGIGGGLGFDRRQIWLDGTFRRRRLGQSWSLLRTLAMASGLFSTAFLASDGRSISLARVPGPPVLRGFSTLKAAITSLGPSWQEPALAILE